MNYELPGGIVQAIAGLVKDCKTEEFLKALNEAENEIGKNFLNNPQAQANRKILIKMVKLNLINRKRFDRETLNRKYGMKISERNLREEKKRFCYILAQKLNIAE